MSPGARPLCYTWSASPGDHSSGRLPGPEAARQHQHGAAAETETRWAETSAGIAR